MQLHGGNCGILVDNHEQNVCRKVCIGNHLHVHAKDFSNLSLGDGSGAQLVDGQILRALDQNLVEADRAVQGSVVLGDQLVVQRRHGVHEHLEHGALGGSRQGRALTGVLGPNLEAILVDFRGHDLPELTGHGLAGLFNHVLLHVVALVDGEGEGAILSHDELLHIVLQLGGAAVPAGSGSCVVVHGSRSDVIDLHALHTGEFHVQILGEAGLGQRFLIETLLYVLGILGCKVNHLLPPILNPR